MAQASKASAVALAVLAQDATATAVLTGFCGGRLALLLGTDSSRRLADAVGHQAKGWIPRWGLRGLVRVHLLTVPPNGRLKSKGFVKSSWLVAMASAQEATSMHFL